MSSSFSSGVFEEEEDLSTSDSNSKNHKEDESSSSDLNSDLVTSNMTPKQKKLFELRLKLNKARKENHTLVAEEDKRKNEAPDEESKRRKREYDDQKLQEKQKMIQHGIDPEKEKIMGVTSSDADYQDKKRRKKEKQKEKSFAWSQYNPESQYNVHEKRVKSIEFNEEEYKTQKEATKEEDFFRDAHSINYGQNIPVDRKKVERMVDELNKSVEKRKNYSRRRAHHEEKYVDYINERNKVFNQKIERAFGQYTAEVKQNLERGTAL